MTALTRLWVLSLPADLPEFPTSWLAPRACLASTVWRTGNV